ncbi:response regulator transcription factor [Planctomyces sp. SH-PL62]|uniref:response regulator transcription factor n=1 Tax=Planctomyces sp. SH-PL62 TaxID=1636152 RepID=UPI00078C4EFB|nr:response regulator transcription factor [Planctomyces sp. SH-PL62]AMV37957.1 Response regulator ArlR [Planctomyces sp. SH-PL62]
MTDAPPEDPTGPGPGPSVLLIDDDLELCDLLREFFAQEGIRLAAAHDGRRGLGAALDADRDLILLDVMLPGLDGFEVLRLLRRRSQVPVIMLTARSAKADRLAGLGAGADDYVPKPFDPDELLARVRAVLRRAGRAARPVAPLEAEGIRLIPTAREVFAGGELVATTTFEYEILEYLVYAAGRIVTRDELTAALYQRRSSPFDRAIDVHVSRLRKKLGPLGSAVRTVRGVGYLFRSGPDDEAPR